MGNKMYNMPKNMQNMEENMKEYARKYAEYGRKYASWHIMHVFICQYAIYADYGQ